MARRSALVVKGRRRTSARDWMCVGRDAQFGESLLVEGHALRDALEGVLQAFELELFEGGAG